MPSVLTINVRMIMADARVFAERHYYQTAQTLLASAYNYVKQLQYCTDGESQAAVRAWHAMRAHLAQTVRFEMAARKFEVSRGW